MTKKHVGARLPGAALALLVICLLVLLTIIVAACGSTDPATTGSSTPTSSSDSNTVHMNDSNFEQPSITIKKGTSLTLINDSSAVHIIANGTWDSNGTPRGEQEKGAPTINTEMDGGADKTFGPFNTAGTFQLYCTVHPGMNLTVIVK
jgi:plastocyanin